MSARFSSLGLPKTLPLRYQHRIVDIENGSHPRVNAGAVGIVISGNLTFSSRMRSAAKIAKSVGLSLHSYGRPLSTSTSFLAVIRGRSTRIRVLREFSFGNLHIFPVIPLSFRIICSFSR